MAIPMTLRFAIRRASGMGGASDACRIARFILQQNDVAHGKPARLTVRGRKDQQVGKRQRRGKSKRHAPAHAQQQQPQQGHANGVGQLGCAIEQRRRQRTLACREPRAHGLCACRKGGRLADAQQQPRGKEQQDARSKCRGHRRQPPDEDGHQRHLAHAEQVQHHAGRQLARGIRPRIGCRQLPEDRGCDAKRLYQRVVRNGQVHAVEIVDQHAQAQQQADRPAIRLRGVVLCGISRGGHAASVWEACLANRENHARCSKLVAAMRRHLHAAVLPLIALAAVAFACMPVSGQAASARERLPPDERAYHAALAVPDPAARLQALRAFSVQFQDSTFFDSVQQAALRLLLDHFPTRTAEIRDQVQVNVANASKGYDRWQEESSEANLLAGAGVLLPLAQQMAEDANRNMTQTNFLLGMVRMYGTLSAPVPSREELQEPYKEARAATLLALAHVYLALGRRQACAALLQQAAALQPLNATVHTLRGQMELAEHHDAEALAELERAQVMGDLPVPLHTAMLALYRQAHDGGDSGLEAELDRRYAEVFPAAFTPPAHTAVSGGHTVLLELFTGSGCTPCAGADLALEALLQSHSRDEVVELEMDEHVPAPDPLANPATVARSAVLGAGNTPSFFLDGKHLSVYGGTRDNVAEVYAGLAKFVRIQGERPSGVQLQLSAMTDAAGVVHATAKVQAQPQHALQQSAAEENAAWPGDALAEAERARAEAAFPPQLTLNFALVEDNVRYSGENGVRTHRMVVRALSSDAAYGDPVKAGVTATFTAAFDPAAISRGLAAYLDHFETANDTFGSFRFLTKDTTMQPSQLAVAAWVQDTRTHRVLGAAFAPASPK